MNKLRDVWRFMSRTYRKGQEPPEFRREGLWVMPYEASAQMAARDAATGITQCSMVPGGAQHYPMINEVAIFRMDCGTPVEVARIRVSVGREGAQPLFDDGQNVLNQKFDGFSIRTHDTWKGLS